MDEELSSLRQAKTNSETMLQQLQQHKQQELKKGEQVRKDLIAQNSILHGQVEKVSNAIPVDSYEVRYRNLID